MVKRAGAPQPGRNGETLRYLLRPALLTLIVVLVVYAFESSTGRSLAGRRYGPHDSVGSVLKLPEGVLLYHSHLSRLECIALPLVWRLRAPPPQETQCFLCTRLLLVGIATVTRSVAATLFRCQL